MSLVNKQTLKNMSRKYGNVKLQNKVTYNKRAVNDRRIIKHWASELFAHKLLGEKIREGYEKARPLGSDYTLDAWYNEFSQSDPILTQKGKESIIRFLHNHHLLFGFAVGKLLRACWVDVEPGIAEIPYKYIYND